MTNSELWKLAEDGLINKGDVFMEYETGNQIIFTGTSFKVYFSSEDLEHVAMYVGYMWEFLKNDLNELVMHQNERR